MRSLNEAVDRLFPEDGTSQLMLGTLVGIDDGRPMIATPDNKGNAQAASALESVSRDISSHGDGLVGSAVLIALVGDQLVVLGLVRDRVVSVNDAAGAISQKLEDEIVIDGDRLVLDARREIVLRCGGSEIVMRKDGKVVIRGNNISSRSAGPNKIKGTSVNIN